MTRTSAGFPTRHQQLDLCLRLLVCRFLDQKDMGVWARVRSAVAGVIWHILDVVLEWSTDAEVDKAFAELKTVSALSTALARDGSGRPYFYHAYEKQ
jgi:hypothetical protein